MLQYFRPAWDPAKGNVFKQSRQMVYLWPLAAGDPIIGDEDECDENLKIFYGMVLSTSSMLIASANSSDLPITHYAK